MRGLDDRKARGVGELPRHIMQQVIALPTARSMIDNDYAEWRFIVTE
jgi:hypothetical protein